MYYSFMNRNTPQTFGETLLLACKLKAPHLLRGENDLHQGKAAEFFGIPQPTFFRWMRTRSYPKDDKIQVLAKKLGLTPAQLRNEMPMPGSDLTGYAVNEKQGLYTVDPPKGLLKVPLISWISAGLWNEEMNIFEEGGYDEWRITTANVSSRAFALRVEGDSMHNPNGSPSIPEGSIIIVDPDIAAISGKIVVARLTDSNQVTLKKLIIDGPNTYLKPLNPDHSLIKINGNCTIVGVVKQVIQDL